MKPILVMKQMTLRKVNLITRLAKNLDKETKNEVSVLDIGEKP